jgi:hypothetical protein
MRNNDVGQHRLSGSDLVLIERFAVQAHRRDVSEHGVKNTVQKHSIAVPVYWTASGCLGDGSLFVLSQNTTCGRMGSLVPWTGGLSTGGRGGSAGDRRPSVFAMPMHREAVFSHWLTLSTFSFISCPYGFQFLWPHGTKVSPGRVQILLNQ